MKKSAIYRSLFMTLVVVLCVSVLGTQSRADWRQEISLERMETPSMYEMMPDIWEYFVIGTKMEWVEVAEVEGNNDNLSAMTVEDGQTILGDISDSTDQNDYYKVVVTGDPKTIFTQLEWTGSAWVNLYMYDEMLEPITYLNENTPSPKALSKWLCDPGTYYIRVKSQAGDSDYELWIGVCGQHGETLNDAWDTTEMHMSVFKDPFKSIIDTSSDPYDFYEVVIPMGTTSCAISLDWFGTLDANLDFEVYTDTGFKATTVSSSTSFETHYSQNVPMGTYYLAVKAVTGRAMYQLTVDAEVDLELDIPIFELEEIPIWGPPFPYVDDILIIDDPVVLR